MKKKTYLTAINQILTADFFANPSAARLLPTGTWRIRPEVVEVAALWLRRRWEKSFLKATEVLRVGILATTALA